MSDNGATVIIPRSRVSPGTTLNGIYRIDSPIAAGGMGEIYKGYAIQTGDAVAIKMIRSDLAENESALALFRKEASSLHNLQHEAIVRYYLFSIDPQLGRAYLAMEFVDGTSLKDHLVRGPLSFEDTCILQQRIASGLHSAHKLGIIHRDVAPDNVILPGTDVAAAKILDFGIARSTKAGEQTIIGSGFAGKYNYVSPEQLGLFGGDVTPKSDIYSFGLVLAECLQGRPLDMNGSQVEVIDKRRVVPDLSKIDPRFRPLLEKMLQPLPEKRPETMAEVAAWLPPVGKTVRSRKPATAGEESKGGGKTGMAIAAGLGALALLGSGLFFGTNLMRGGEQTQVASLANEEALAVQAANRAAEQARLQQARERETQLAAQAEAARLAEASRIEAENRRIADARAAEEARRQAEAKAAEDARAQAEAREAEGRRIAAEAIAAEEARKLAEAKAADERRIAAEARAAEEARKLAEAKTAEDVRRLNEARIAEDRRLAAEARAAEEARKVADAKAAEEARRIAEARAIEERRVAEAKASEDRRIAAEAKAAEEARKLAEARAAEEARRQAAARAAEERRLAAEAKAAEDARKLAEARAEEEARRQAQQARIVEERRIAAEAKAAEEARKVAEAKAAEDARRQAQARLAEERRLAAEAKASEEARRIAEAKATEDARIRQAELQLEETRRAEASRIAAESERRQTEEQARLAAVKAEDDAKRTIDSSAAETRSVTEDTPVNERQRLALEQAQARWLTEEAEALRRAGVTPQRTGAVDPDATQDTGPTPDTRIAAVDPTLLQPRAITPSIPQSLPIPTDPVALTKETQTELKRVGCYAGPISGNINKATREALRVFRQNAKLKAEPASVSPEQLLDLRKQQEDVCEQARPAPQRPAIVRRPPREREAPVRRAQQPAAPQRQAVSRPAPAAAPAAPAAAPRRQAPIGLGF